MVNCISFENHLGMLNHFIKKYTILVERAIPVTDIIMYETNLAFIWSLFLKFLFTFNEKEVIIPQVSLIIFDGMIGSQSHVKSRKMQQSTIVHIVDKIMYKKACFASFLALLRTCSSFIFSRIYLSTSFHLAIYLFIAHFYPKINL